MHFAYPTEDRIYYNDRFRKHFQCFEGKYRFVGEELSGGKSHATVERELALLKQEIVPGCVSSKDADLVIHDAISQFLEYKKQSTVQILQKTRK